MKLIVRLGETRIRYFRTLCIFSTRTAQQVCYLSSASVHASTDSSRRCRKLCRKFDLRGAQVEYDSAINSHAIFLREHSRRCVKCLPREQESGCRAPTAISSPCRWKRSGKARSSPSNDAWSTDRLCLDLNANLHRRLRRSATLMHAAGTQIT